MDEIKLRLLDLFKEYANGMENAKNKTFFCAMLGHVHERNFRALAEELVMDGEPICSHPDFGYWYAESIEDGDAALADLKSRETKLRERRTKLERNIYQVYGGQRTMF